MYCSFELHQREQQIRLSFQVCSQLIINHSVTVRNDISISDNHLYAGSAEWLVMDKVFVQPRKNNNIVNCISYEDDDDESNQSSSVFAVFLSQVQPVQPDRLNYSIPAPFGAEHTAAWHSSHRTGPKWGFSQRKLSVCVCVDESFFVSVLAHFRVIRSSAFLSQCNSVWLVALDSGKFFNCAGWRKERRNGERKKKQITD